ncbi:DUF7144 family membrane protein [Streptomyces sp. NPDC002911]
MTPLGWIHVILGVFLVLAGWGIPKGTAWGVGIVPTALNLIAGFIRLPYQPLWAIISLALGTFVIWALCAHRAKPAV